MYARKQTFAFILEGVLLEQAGGLVTSGGWRGWYDLKICNLKPVTRYLLYDDYRSRPPSSMPPSARSEAGGDRPVLTGSVVERFAQCGNPNCRCNADPPQVHGPYWQWSTAVNGKTVTRRVDPEDVPLYLEWIENRKRVEVILAQMHELALWRPLPQSPRRPQRELRAAEFFRG